jgi:hypothetical protein
MKDNDAIKAFPLCWPDGWARTQFRTGSSYKVTTDVALDELLASIRQLGGRDIIVSSNVPIRRDGAMYRGDHAEARMPDPGVAVYWTARGPKGEAVPRVIPCDHWYTVRENVRALGMAIDYIRGLKRCGAGEIQDRAFAGFARLSETTSDAWSVLGVKRYASRQELTERLRELTRTEHPDHGGSTEGFSRLTSAYHAALEALEATATS